MTKTTEHLVHGRETYMVDFGDAFVMKRPLPTFGPDARNAWLEKQHRTNRLLKKFLRLKIHAIIFHK